MRKTVATFFIHGTGLFFLGGGMFAAACSSSDDPAGPGPQADAAGTADVSSPTTDGGSTVEDGGSREGGGDGGAKGLDLSQVGDKTWAWFEFPGAVCRDGSPTGIGLNLNRASKKMMIFLQGGGACYNAPSCATNPPKVASKSGANGIFDRSKGQNPVGEWNHVFVPYCTGDVHAGNNPEGNIDGVGPQKFVGYANMGLFLTKLAATFPDVEEILVTGTSAGGFGAAANYGQTVRHFPAVRVNLVDDSGPLMREPPLARCLQEQWKTLWKLDATVIAECGADCTGKPDFLIAISKHWAATKSTHAQGLISATEDGTIRQFFGFGAANCTSFAPISGPDFAAGLTDIRTQSAAYSNFGTYTYEGTGHTLLEGAGFYTTTVDSKSPAAWVKDIVDSNAVTNVGP